MSLSPNAEATHFKSAAALTEDQEWTRLAAKLYTASEAGPLEDGIDHPAEEIIGEALRSSEDRRIRECLSVLRCLGRQVSPGTASWRAGFVRAGLAMGHVEMRDAAVQAAESWGERDWYSQGASRARAVALRVYSGYHQRFGSINEVAKSGD